MIDDPPRRQRRPREIVERLPGPGGGRSSYIVDADGARSIEDADTLTTILLRIWPDVSMRIAHAWRPVEQEETVE